VDEAVLQDDEEEGRQLLEDEVFVGHLDRLLLFGEGVEHDDFLRAFGDDVVLVVEEGGGLFVELEGGFGGELLLGLAGGEKSLLHLSIKS
jgi:hypothetical protein